MTSSFNTATERKYVVPQKKALKMQFIIYPTCISCTGIVVRATKSSCRDSKNGLRKTIKVLVEYNDMTRTEVTVV